MVCGDDGGDSRSSGTNVPQVLVKIVCVLSMPWGRKNEGAASLLAQDPGNVRTPPFTGPSTLCILS